MNKAIIVEYTLLNGKEMTGMIRVADAFWTQQDGDEFCTRLAGLLEQFSVELVDIEFQKMNEDKLQRARRIIAKLLAEKIFDEWEQRTESDLLSLLSKYDRELDLGINPSAVLDTMIREGIIHENGTYNDQKFYATIKAKEKVTI